MIAERLGGPVLEAAAGRHDPMSDVAPDVEDTRAWLDGNQLLLKAELRRLAALLDLAAGSPGAGDALDRAQRDVAAVRLKLPAGAAIDHVADVFALSPFERDLVLLCAGVEIEASIAGRCQAVTGGPWVTFALALSALPDPHWSALLPGAPLRRWRLIAPSSDQVRVHDPIAMCETVVHALMGITTFDSLLDPFLRSVPVPRVLVTSQRDVAVRAAAEIRRRGTGVVQLNGDDRDGLEDVAAAAASALGMSLHMVRAGDIPSDARDRHLLGVTWARDAALADAALLVDATEAPPARIVTDFIASAQSTVVVLAREPLDLAGLDTRMAVDRPLVHERAELWNVVARALPGGAASRLAEAASRLPLSVRDVLRAADMLEGAGASDDIPELIRRVRPHSPATSQRLWERVESGVRWADLVLPAEQLETLHQVASQVRLAAGVYEDWGFAQRDRRAQGLAVLFAGESGTGKTLAAEVLANELSLDLYRIDLSTVVSKYIGETEKSLHSVFESAEAAGAVLLFDEADALFGKRGEVRDGHDRYANLEVSYLLQRMEAYHGLAILTTNMRGSIDRAFMRRLRFVVQFPFPDAALRERLWRAALPERAPRRGIDFARLAQLGLSGGSIRNVAINGAFLAAAEGRPISMRHLLRAATTEAAKRERLAGASELQGRVGS